MKIAVLVSTEIQDSGLGYFDKKSMEAVQKIVEENEDVHVTCVTVGSSEDEGVLRECLSRKVQRAVLIQDDNYTKANCYSVAKALGEFLKKENFELVLCGYKSHGGGTGIVPCLVAEILNIPHVTDMFEIAVDDNCGSAICISEYGNYRETLKFNLPAVISCKNDRANLKTVGLAQVMKAFNKEIEIFHPTIETAANTENLAGCEIAEFKVKLKRKQKIFGENEVRQFSEAIMGLMS